MKIIIEMTSWRLLFIGIIIICFGSSDSLRSLHIHVPRAVMSGQDVTLTCSYDLEGAQLYSIRWYTNSVEFYRYVPKESPATKVFPVAEIKVDLPKSDDTQVTLNQVGRSSTGVYQCEVSADAPSFHTDFKEAKMVVVEPPLLSPNITTNRMSYVGGDHIRANCTSPPSFPAANITWFVNEQMVPGFTAANQMNYSNGYASSRATLELEAAAVTPVPTLMIRCEAHLFDVWKATSNTLVLREKSANPASALGRSFSGVDHHYRISITALLLLPIVMKYINGSFVCNLR